MMILNYTSRHTFASCIIFVSLTKVYTHECENVILYVQAFFRKMIMAKTLLRIVWSAIFLWAALFVVPTGQYANVALAQEFDWDDDFLQARKNNREHSQNSSRSNLPGVRDDPGATPDPRCNRISLSELLGQELASGRCPPSTVTIFEVVPTDRQTDSFLNSPR